MKQKIFMFLLAVFTAMSTGTLFATDVTVQNTSDSGTGSLRQAIEDCPEGGTIDFDNSLVNATITLQSALVINKDITILGSGQKLVPQSENYPGIHIPNPNDIGLAEDAGPHPYLKIHRIWFDGFFNKGANGRDWGGAISSSKTSTIFLTSCIFTNNRANGEGQALNKTWNPNGGNTPERFYAYGCTFINTVDKNLMHLHEEPPIAYGNVFINPNYLTRNQLDAPNNGDTRLEYNVYSGSLISGTISSSNLQVSVNPLDVTYVPTTCALQIVPSGIPNYPTEDFYGHAIEGYAGAIQPSTTPPLGSGVTQLNPNYASLAGEPGQPDVQLSVEFTPNNVIKPKLTYSSGNDNIVTVSETGLVHYVGVGNTDITISECGGQVVSVPVSVTQFVAIDMNGWNGTTGAPANVGDKSVLVDSRDGDKHYTVIKMYDGKFWTYTDFDYKNGTENTDYRNRTVGSNNFTTYSWNAAQTICPTGWHLASTADWQGLKDGNGGGYSWGSSLNSSNLGFYPPYQNGIQHEDGAVEGGNPQGWTFYWTESALYGECDKAKSVCFANGDGFWQGYDNASVSYLPKNYFEMVRCVYGYEQITALGVPSTTINGVQGTTQTVTPIFTPSTTSDKRVTWTVFDESREDVVTVCNGLLSFNNVGTAKVKVASVTDANKYAVIDVTVYVAHADGVSLPQGIYGVPGGTANLGPLTTAIPDYAENREVDNSTWTSSNPAVATVSNGIVTFHSVGTAVISVNAADQTNATPGNAISGSATVTVEPLIDSDGFYNRKSWVIAANQNGTTGIYSTFNNDTEGAWKYESKNYPMALFDGSLKSGWESGTDNPKYVIIDMKAETDVNYVDISGPLEGINTDWPAGCLKGYINVYLTSNLPTSFNFSEYTVDWAAESNTRKANYAAWTNALVLPNISSGVPVEWGDVLVTAIGEYSDKNANPNKPAPFVLPQNSTGRYLIIEFEKSWHGDNIIALGEIKVHSGKFPISAVSSDTNLGSASVTPTEANAGETTNFDLTATLKNSTVVNFINWTLESSVITTDPVYTHQIESLDASKQFVANFELKARTEAADETPAKLGDADLYNSTEWGIGSNVGGGAYHGNGLQTLLWADGRIGWSHAATQDPGSLYFVIDMGESRWIDAISLISTDYSEEQVENGDVRGHWNDLFTRTTGYSIFLTNNNIFGSYPSVSSDLSNAPATWGSVQGYKAAETYLQDANPDYLTVVVPKQSARYAVVFFHDVHNWFEFSGIRFWGAEPAGDIRTVSYAAEDPALGTVVPTGVEAYYNAGSTATFTLTAVPVNRLVRFVKWQLNTEDYPDTSNPLEYTGTISENLDFVAVFESTLPDLKYDRKHWTAVSRGGDFSGQRDGGQSVWSGGNPMLTLDGNPLSGYHYNAFSSPWDEGTLYIVVDMKESLAVDAVTLKCTASDDKYKAVDFYVTDYPIIPEYNVNYCSATKEADYYAYEGVDPSSKDPFEGGLSATLPNISTGAPSDWGGVKGSLSNIPNPTPDAVTCVFNATATGRYLVVAITDRYDHVHLGEIEVYGSGTQTFSYNVWTGASDNNSWDNANNWCRGDVPLSGAKVLVPSDKDRYPEVKAYTQIQDLTLEPGAELGGQKYLYVWGTTTVSYDLSSNRNRLWGITVPLDVAASAFITDQSTTVWEYTGVPEDGGIAYKQLLAPPLGSQPSLTPGLGYLLWLKGYAVDGKFTVSGTLPQIQTETLNFDFHDGTDGSHFAFIGNPLLSTIDFEALYELGNNSNIIHDNYTVVVQNKNNEVNEVNEYAVYVGGENGGYAGPVDEELNQYIAPFQGFFVEAVEEEEEEEEEEPEQAPQKVATASADDNYPYVNTCYCWGTGKITLAFTAEEIAALGLEKETRPLNLKAPAAVANKLTITATAGDNGYITFISRRENGSQIFGKADATKMLGSANILPVVYTLKPTAKGDVAAVAGNIIDDAETLIPVALKTTYSGAVSLRLAGMDAFNATITLIDNLTGAQIDLTGKAEYEYSFDYAGSTEATTDRFAVRIGKSATAISTLGDAAIAVYSAGKSIYASAASKIEKIEVYSIAGTLVYSEKPAATCSAITLSAPAGIYSVRVATANGLKTAKVIVK